MLKIFMILKTPAKDFYGEGAKGISKKLEKKDPQESWFIKFYQVSVWGVTAPNHVRHCGLGCVRIVDMIWQSGCFHPLPAKDGGDTDPLIQVKLLRVLTAVRSGELDLEALISLVVNQEYAKTPSFAEVAYRLKVDPRTVKKYLK